MTWSLVLAVALGGAIGAPTRYLIDSRISHAAQQRGYGFFPWGLLVVNVIGSFVIGIAYVSLEGPMRALLATGACGALTTYSSYALFVNRVWSEKRSTVAVIIALTPQEN